MQWLRVVLLVAVVVAGVRAEAQTAARRANDQSRLLLQAANELRTMADALTGREASDSHLLYDAAATSSDYCGAVSDLLELRDLIAAPRDRRSAAALVRERTEQYAELVRMAAIKVIPMTFSSNDGIARAAARLRSQLDSSQKLLRLLAQER